MASTMASIIDRDAVNEAGWDMSKILSQVDFSDHSNRQGQILWINAVFISLISVVVGMRLFTRIFVVRRVFLDDVLILTASAFTITLCAICLLASKQADLGEHVWNLDLSQAIPTVKKCIQYLFVTYIFYACAIAFTKLSIIASYIRIIPERGFRVAMFITAAIVTALGICSVFTIIFQCRPVKAAWDFSIQGKCINFVSFLYASSAVGLLTDLILTLVPIPYFWKVKLPKKQRIILILLFGLGSVASIALIIRFTTLNMLKDNIDVTCTSEFSRVFLEGVGYDLGCSIAYRREPRSFDLVVEGLNWTVVECALGIICVSIPPIRALLIQISPSTLSTQLTSKRTQNDSVFATRRESWQGLRRKDDASGRTGSVGSRTTGEYATGEQFFATPHTSGSRDVIVSYDVTVDIEMAHKRTSQII